MYIHIVICIKILTNADCSKIFPKQIVYKTNTMLIITRQRIAISPSAKCARKLVPFERENNCDAMVSPFSACIALELGCYYRGGKVIRITCTISRALP